jgi:hypothetical protein
MEDSKTILEIERLVKAQADPPLVTTVALSDGSSRVYAVQSGGNGRTLGSEIEPPSPDLLSVTTLTGFLDAIKAGAAGNMAENRIIHVENYLSVSVKSATPDNYGNRATFLTAKHPPMDAFKFDEYYTDPARFLIGLQVAFHQTEEMLYLIKVASNLKAGNSVQTQDDGFSQTITLKAGEVSTAEVKIKPRIKLIPIRTFAEANPVESEFLIRFKQTQDQTPAIALFNVDGSKWQGETMLAIKKYLASHLDPKGPILA